MSPVPPDAFQLKTGLGVASISITALLAGELNAAVKGGRIVT